jgi:hypothetical protein
MGHTPGPWRASEGWPSDLWNVDMPGRKWSLLVARHDEDFDMPVEEVQANAHLIAAAPELLAACREMAEIIHSMSESGAGVAAGAAAPYMAVIAKAEGRTDED